MTIQAQITEKLKHELGPSHLEVINESHSHNVPPNSETHFKVIIVSSVFNDLNRVKRQQCVYRILAEELSSGVHALSQHTFTPEEWEKADRSKLQSPDCRGGGAS